MLDLIGRLYAVEAQVPVLRADTTAEDRAGTLVLRARLRAEQSRGIVGEIRAWAHGQRVLPRSTLGSAITYMLGLWPGLTRFLDDPRIPIDNNHTERGIRGVVLGRKNHYGSRSQRGTEVAALFYSLIESAKLCGVDPKAYLLKQRTVEGPTENPAPQGALKSIATAAITDFEHPCGAVLDAIRLSDGSIRAVCSNGEAYLVFSLSPVLAPR